MCSCKAALHLELVELAPVWGVYMLGVCSPWVDMLSLWHHLVCFAVFDVVKVLLRGG